MAGSSWSSGSKSLGTWRARDQFSDVAAALLLILALIMPCCPECAIHFSLSIFGGMKNSNNFVKFSQHLIKFIYVVCDPDGVVCRLQGHI